MRARVRLGVLSAAVAATVAAGGAGASRGQMPKRTGADRVTMKVGKRVVHTDARHAALVRHAQQQQRETRRS
jgi:hypothetical protein